MLARMVGGFRAALWGVTLLYPLALYWALTRHGAVAGAAVGLVSALLWAARAALAPEGSARTSLWSLPLVVLALSGLTLLTSDQRLLLALPVLINTTLLVTFAGSLFSRQSYVERWAQLREPHLTPEQIKHCRQFTWVWSIFFVLNGGITAALALAEAMVAWTFYTSGISYVLIALLFLLEYGVRRHRFHGLQSASKTRELEP